MSPENRVQPPEENSENSRDNNNQEKHDGRSEFRPIGSRTLLGMQAFTALRLMIGASVLLTFAGMMSIVAHECDEGDESRFPFSENKSPMEYFNPDLKIDFNDLQFSKP